MKKNNIKKGMAPYIVLTLIMVLIYTAFVSSKNIVHDISADKFYDYAEKSKIVEVTLTPNTDNSVYVVEGKLSGYADEETFKTLLPYSDETVRKLNVLSEENDFGLEIEKDPNSGTLLLVLFNFLPIVLLGVFAFFIFSKASGGAGKSMDFGKSRAKLSSEKNKTTFKDVAGLTEEKEEVKELIDFLKNPKKFQKMGARIPKGVLLVGPPGTGKTLLAKSIAGEANVPFYFISGSDFVELFVGVGASRVRDMFKQAKMNAPCLIFIDEIDAVGRQRGSGIGGGHDEREQTLNQLLTEMDGFGENEGIILIAATNRDDVLDPALLRPGRFDRKVIVSLPDVKGRTEILKVHAKNKPIASDVTMKNLAKRTPGFSGADLENLLNEAALLTVRRNKDKITMEEIDEATDRVLMGPAKVSRKHNELEKKIVSYHEAGHAVIGIKHKGASEVHKITIIPRGHAGGYVMSIPKDETFNSTKTELLANIVGLLGGRVTEELIFNEITTGAHNDIEKATKIARAMVTEYGMSDLGAVQYEHTEGSVFLGRDYNKSRNFSEAVALEIDKEVKKIIDDCYVIAKDIINSNRDLLELIASAVLEYETLTKEQIDNLVKYGTITEPTQDSNDSDTTNDDSNVSIEETSKDLSKLNVSELKEMAKNKNIENYSKMKKDELIKALEEEK